MGWKAGGAILRPDGVVGFKFLKALGHDNSKAFFDRHRSTYEGCLLEPAKAFVSAIGPVLQGRISPDIHAEPLICPPMMG